MKPLIADAVAVLTDRTGKVIPDLRVDLSIGGHQFFGWSDIRGELKLMPVHAEPPSPMSQLIDLLETASHSDRFVNAHSHRRLEILETARCVLRDAAQSLFDRLTSDDIESFADLSLGETVCFQMAIMHLLDANLKLAGELSRLRDAAKAAN